MRQAAWLLLLAFCVSGCAGSQNERIAERFEPLTADFEPYFEEAGVDGTFVLYHLEADRFYIYDAERAKTPFIPASTFKILNSLIALETGVIADTSVVFEWDGRRREIAPWNRDHSMTTAFRNSVVWYYQELARRIGEERMHDYVRDIGYGNGDVGGGIDRFWLTGDLRISPLEQIDFLVRLHEDSLPFSNRTLTLVKGIMVEETGDDYVLRAKTGWAEWTPVDVGWYVGYVEREEGTYFFALNMDIERSDQGAERRRIAHAILRDLGLL